MRQARNIGMTGTLLALAWSMPAAAQNVDPNNAESIAAGQAYIDRMEAYFAQIEAARQRGDCAAFEDGLDAAAVYRVGERPIGVVSLEQTQALQARLDAIEALGCPAGGETSASFFGGLYFGATYGSLDLGEYSVGFTRDGAVGQAPDLPAGFLDERLDTWGGEGFFYIPGTETLMNIGRPIRVGLRYEEGGRASVFDIPSNAHDFTGIVYGGRSPADSTGIGTPGFALFGDLYSSYRGWEANVAVPILGAPLETKRMPVSLDALFGVRLTDRDHRSMVQFSEMLGGFTYQASQHREQQLDGTFYDFGLDGQFYIPLGGSVMFKVEGYVGGYYRTTEFDSIERNLCNFCPVADRDFTLNIAESDNGWGLRGSGSVAVEWWLSPDFGLSLGGELDYLSSVGQVANPTSGDEVLANVFSRVEFTNSIAYRASLGGRFRF